MLKELAYAKLNLNLHVLPNKLRNGYYEIRFINCELELHDELHFEKIKDKIELICNNPELSQTENNLIYKTAVLLKSFIRQSLGVRIVLNKNIPIKAGLGGGSSDAAVAIKTLTKLWQVKLDQNQFFKIANELGRDVYYCLQGGVCEVKRDGSKVVSLNSKMPDVWLIIIIPEEIKSSTAWMYKHLDKHKIGRNLDKFERLKQALIKKNPKEVISNLFNDFEASVIQKFPIVEKIKKDLENSGATNSLLAGSGLSVVGFFEDKNTRDRAYGVLKKLYNNLICTNTI